MINKNYLSYVFVLCSTLFNHGCVRPQETETDIVYTDHVKRTECSIACIGHVTSDVPIYCDVLQKDIDTAKTVLVENNVLTADEFCPLYESTKVKVVNECFPADEKHDDIRIGYSGFTLVHELLHQLDISKGATGTWDHPNWEENGYDFADLSFLFDYDPIDGAGNGCF